MPSKTGSDKNTINTANESIQNVKRKFKSIVFLLTTLKSR